MKTLVTDLWAANIGMYRANLAAAQDRAEKELQVKGVRLTVVPPGDLAGQRRLMMAEQDTVAREMRISSDVVARVIGAVAVAN